MTAFLDPPRPRAFAHRGWHLGDEIGVENTMAAFRAAVTRGYGYLETDVRCTADGELVVFHDPVLDRVTDRTGEIAALSWRDVTRARVGGREPVPRLADVLAEFPDIRFNLDAKSDAAVDPLLRVLEQAQAWDRVCLGAFSDQRLARLAAGAPSSTARSLGPGEVFALVRASVARRPFRPPTTGRVVAAQIPVRFRRVPVVTRSSVRTAHRAGLEVHVWTVDDPREMHRLLDLGVDGLMTDRPDVLRQVLRQRSSPRPDGA
ncbi:glycerophosphodiester phosphodiesterase [Nakamurella leprariae]|uniref:Glycerophosphodiester phosphodiesterase n=1 Tax=Nakamurella leprariae TaxID=2803911 RepID=A0A938Y8H1_9ACTN|nr:glycerophosphodiester phosphodiesterase [Nakamurella leprariae]MBM9465902.1 glycerophosphodiester phosphodiesterase [Nakamurella leprariae]